MASTQDKLQRVKELRKEIKELNARSREFAGEAKSLDPGAGVLDNKLKKAKDVYTHANTATIEPGCGPYHGS